MSYLFLMFMAEYFNFTYKLIDHNGDYGYQEVSNYNYTGLMESVISGDTLFAMGGLSVRMAYDNPFVQMSEEIKTSRITYMTLDSEPINVKGVILRPFGLLQRGNRNMPTGYGVNFIIQISWFSGLFLMAFYSTEIKSALTNLQSKRNIATLNEFCEKINDKSVVPLVVKGATLRSFFIEHQEENDIFEILSQNMEIVSSSTNGIERMVESRLQRKFKPTKIYAIIASYDTLEMLANRFGVKYFNFADTIASSVFTDRYGLLFSNNFTFTSYFNKCIRLAQAHGFFSKWHRKQYKLDVPWNSIDMMLNEIKRDHNVGFAEAKENSQILRIKNVAECFLLYICCMAITILTFITEILWKSIKISKPLMRKILLKRILKHEKLERTNSQEEKILPDIEDTISEFNQKQVALYGLLRRRGSQNL
ncbi:hypothetical protein BLA29_005393 [Euroglyphus maynei]|uniref:Ionotropic glutamate receptor C-terminal domain-containing protein n=1 Tax=Euroglyphus maynei TaxID=6958 RepID=A0A1Y3B5S8_EURMA|nr:hypothetical protein BLA29_005393 [Euroglyphus maynei]